MLPVRSLSKIILENKSSKRFLFATVASFAFSMTVILATMGLMDGFELSLKKALLHSNGDIKFSSVKGFFKYSDELENKLSAIAVGDSSSLLQLESFALVHEESKGVLIRGILPEKFSKMTELDFSQLKNGIYIGTKFQKKYNLKIGDEIVLALSRGKAAAASATILQSFTIEGVVHHGIYEKDFRYIYMDKTKLEELIGYAPGTSNVGIIKLRDFDTLKKVSGDLNKNFEDNLFFQPFWIEFKTLLDAVKIQKFSISLVLQLIVLVAILNIMAFIVFIAETKAKDFFMLRALGMSNSSYQKFWYVLLFVVWVLSCLLSQFFIFILNNFVLRLPFFQIPGDVYVLSKIEVILDVLDYIYVYGLSYVWILLIGYFTMRWQRKKPLISGLRQELG